MVALAIGGVRLTIVAVALAISGGGNSLSGGVKDATNITPQAPGASAVTPVGGLSSSVIGVCPNEAQSPGNRVLSSDQSGDHVARVMGRLQSGGVGGTDYVAVHGSSGRSLDKAVRYETATADVGPDAAFPNTYLNKTDPAVTVVDGESIFSVEP